MYICTSILTYTSLLAVVAGDNKPLNLAEVSRTFEVACEGFSARKAHRGHYEQPTSAISGLCSVAPLAEL